MKTPLHVGLAQSIHDTCRSKQLIQVMNRLGICISYDEMERIDFGLAENVIRRTETGKVPISPNIQQSMLVQGVMDNFDHEENTASGKGVKGAVMTPYLCCSEIPMIIS